MSSTVVIPSVTETEPKKRGRPARKAAENASSAMKELATKKPPAPAATKNGEPQAKRGRGRPPKDESNAEKKTAAKKATVKKSAPPPGKGSGKRGRPKKIEVASTEQADSAEEAPAEE